MYKLVALLVMPMLLIGCGTQYSALGTEIRANNPGYFASYREPTGKKTFVFSPRHMAWAAYDEEGYRVKAGPASGGVYSCPEDGADCRTTVGNFAVQRKGSADCTSGKYPLGEGGAPMAYCMHFNKGYAIHGASGVPNYHSSHGCIRVTTSDARWLNKEFLSVGDKVIVEPY